MLFRSPKITDNSIQEGIEETHWPGRSEWIGNNIYLDGAHNPQGIASLKQVLKDNFANRKVHILFAGLRRKPLADLLEELKAYDITVTSFDFFEALPLDDYPQHFKQATDYKDWLIQADSASPDARAPLKASPAPAVFLTTAEIGRASCRERVYVLV